MTVPTPPPPVPPPPGPAPGSGGDPYAAGAHAGRHATGGAGPVGPGPVGPDPVGPDPVGPDPVGEASLGELFGNVTRDLSTLMRQELALAQAELRQEASKTGKAAGALSGAGVAAFFVVLFLSLALWAGLSNVMDAGWAGLVVALIWAVIAAVLFVIGRGKLREVHPKPERTVDTLSSVPDALRGHQGGTP